MLTPVALLTINSSDNLSLVIAADFNLTRLAEFWSPCAGRREPLPRLGLRQFALKEAKSAGWINDVFKSDLRHLTRAH